MDNCKFEITQKWNAEKEYWEVQVISHFEWSKTPIIHNYHISGVNDETIAPMILWYANGIDPRNFMKEIIIEEV